ncbi:MAG TPA: group II intron maturase-specific domain-containing protein, partial [Casimicrobiaceae bacterium]|nr:group II intron maturase-specific domain-containing protein [Casimicrobiaceae bacterium]
GWAEYHKTINAKTTYSYVDQRIWRALWHWAKRRHPRKGRRWVKDRYFARLGTRRWILNDVAVTQDGRKIVVKLYAAIDTRIIIHRKVEGDLNPFLPEWEPALEARATLRMIDKLKDRKRLLRLWLSQDGVCPVCEHSITMDEAFHAHHIHPKQLGGSDRLSNLVLLHPNCHRQVHFG